MSEARYDRMTYRRSGRSGLVLPAISLGLWHNFGSVDPLEEGRAMVRRSFDLGITHFDLANNTSALIGATRLAQIEDNVAALDNLALSDDELRAIDRVLGGMSEETSR